MASIIVCGGSVIGLSTAMMLARDGHEVTVLESDPNGPPDTPAQAWEAWDRTGVAQFRQPHNLFARFRQVCDAELPGMTDKLDAAGLAWMDPLASLPPGIADRESRPGDDVFRFVTGRRPVIESVFAAAAAHHPGVTVRRGVRVTGLLADRAAFGGVPHMTGVRTVDGEELSADLVIDAMGRRSRAADLLAAVGAGAPHEEAEDSGYAYYTRYFAGPVLPALFAPPLTPLGTISVLTLPGDNDTWSVTVFGASGDAPLKQLRDADCFSRVLRGCPLHAHWLDGEPITDVLAMAGVLDRYRRFVVRDTPVATGFVAVGDAWACTNPSAGRGLSVGLVHAQILRHAARLHLDDPVGFARAFDGGTQRGVAPFYWSQIAADRDRVAEMTALRENRSWTAPASPMTGLMNGAPHDADLFRAMIEIVVCLAPAQEVIERPHLQDTLDRWSREPVPPPLGPDRRQLLELLSASA